MSATTVPARRKAPAGIHASMLPSNCPDDDVTMHNRQDPYWGRLWAPGSQALWSTGPMTRQRRHNAQQFNTRLALSEEKAMSILTSSRGRSERLAAWGVLDSWRTVSAEQMAALTGSQLLLSPRYSQIAASYSIDLIDIGLFANLHQPRPGLNRHTLYRPGSSAAFEKLITPTLTWPEWVSVTGGYPWSFGGQYDRHNLLATELALRAAEYLDIGTVLGEKFSSVDLLAGTGLGKEVAKPDNRRADGTIVRTDGLRIVYELTATASKSFAEKVRRWAQTINDRPLETSGLVIIFVAAPHPDRPRNTSDDPRHAIYKTIAQVLKEFPGTGTDSPAARIGVAHWEEWFPAQHEVSEDFFTLRADFATSHAAGAAKWESRHMLTEYPFTPWKTFDATAVLANAPALAATPHWMRRGDHTALFGAPMDRSGETVPHPAPVRAHRSSGRPLGAGVGLAKDTRLPRRLRVQS
ncbi:hypothetical protein [Arthrobacter sp. A2-55]|uniref:hypothetical protein n=1 Tax=Arthrobacter sp. A2-55 TaxID=2897337 RepID=UPI0021CD93F8|nr:hypothetical protein [Arthrobacter sp. A2-55]MCU6481919.1 hypothetical protein [Arthrobacter sp. A2-55]